MNSVDKISGYANHSKVRRLACLVPSLQVGGSERAMATLASHFADHSGLDVHLIAYGRSKEKFYSLSKRVEYVQPNFDFDSGLRLLSTLKTLAFLRNTLKKNQYDAVLSFGERWNSFVMLACLGLNLRIFLSDRSSPNLNLGFVQSALRRILYPGATALIAQTEKYAELAHSLRLNSHVKVVPNPVLRRELAPEARRKNVILTVGRLITTKHHDRLIKIFASLPDKRWDLVIAGDDAQKQRNRERLVHLTQELGISDRVHLVGARSDIESFYDRAKIFAFTSSSEGFPNVVAEALASGLPVVSYDCVAGPSDLIADGENGFLVDLYDDNAFCDRIGRLMADESKRRTMSAHARNSVSHLSPERIAFEILSIMQLTTE